jgi:hypothetical protein
MAAAASTSALIKPRIQSSKLPSKPDGFLVTKSWLQCDIPERLLVENAGGSTHRRHQPHPFSMRLTTSFLLIATELQKLVTDGVMVRDLHGIAIK